MDYNIDKKNWRSSLSQFRKRNRFLYFLISLILLIVIAPFLRVNVIGQTLLLIIVIAVLISGINSVSNSRKFFLISCILGAPWVIVSFVTTISGKLHPEFYEALFGSIFFIYTTVLIFSHVLKDKRVTADTLYGAICVYILLGITWSFFYVLESTIFPGAYSFVPQHYVDNILDWPDFVYYSFVTLTTLGYGDITPITQPSRTLAFIEAIVGQVYLAIIVARLVAMYISHSPRSEATEK